MLDLKKVIIRTATKKDFPQIVRLYKQLWDDWVFDKAKLYEIFLTDIKTERKEYFLGLIDNNIVGVCSIYYVEDLHIGKRGTLGEFVVDKKQRHKGIGSLLLERTIKKAKDKKCNCVMVNSQLKRLEAHQFYESRKFEKRGFYFLRFL